MTFEDSVCRRGASCGEGGMADEPRVRWQVVGVRILPRCKRELNEMFIGLVSKCEW